MNRQAAARLDALERRVAALEAATPSDDADPVYESGGTDGRPTARDSRVDIDAYARAAGLDTTGEPNKAAALAAIEAADV